MGSGRGPSSGAVIGGVVLLIVGVAFLLRNTGLLRVDWSVIWPAVIIAIGAVLIVGALRRGGGDGLTSVTIPADGAARMDLSLRLGAGRYRLGAGVATGSLVEVTASGPTIDHRVERAGDTARVRLATAVDSWNWGRFVGGTDWQIRVAPGVPVSLDLQAGAGSFDLDLEGVAVTGGTCGIGAADLRVVLPRPRGEVPLRVEGGAAQFTFEIPAGVQARVTSTGLVTTSGPSETPGYASAADRVTVSVSGGAAAVRVVPRP